MNPSPDRSSLLADVLAEAQPGDFRDALLETTLRNVRRRRRGRVLLRAALPVLVVIGGALFAWRGLQESGTEPLSGPAGYTLVHTTPFAAESMVTTRAMDPTPFVVSTEFAIVVHTTAVSGGVRLIGDAELLALAGPRPAVLVRLDAHSQRLIFADEGDKPGGVRVE